MTKTIKFNIILDGKSIRTLNELKENFNIDDVYDLYENGVLKKWLDVRGYEKESEKLDQLHAENDVSKVIIGLIRTFSLEVENFNPKEAAYSQIYRIIKKVELEQARKDEFDYTKLIEQYHFDYELLKEILIDNKNSFDFIKRTINELSDRFVGLFTLDRREFYYKFINLAPLAVYAALMNNALRKIMLEDEIISGELQRQNNDVILLELGDSVKKFKGSTEGMWKYIGQVGKKYMVIKLSSGACRVGEQCSPDADLASGDINGKYRILDGLLFKSTSDSLEVVYMEV